MGWKPCFAIQHIENRKSFTDDLINIYNYKFKNCAYLDSDLYSMKVWYPWVNMSNWLNSYTTGNGQKLWTSYLLRRRYEIFSTWILCKRITFVASFMPQTWYFHVIRWILGETLTFCEIKFCQKIPPKPYCPGIIVQYFQNNFILLGTLNVRVLFKH